MKQVIVGGFRDFMNIAVTEYNCIMGGANWASDPDNVAHCIPSAGTIRNLRIELNDVPGTGTYTFTLYRAVGTGAWGDTTLTCTVAADGTIASDVAHDVSVAAGDVVCIKCAPSSPDNARTAIWTFEYEGDTANESLLLSTGRVESDATNYFHVTGRSSKDTTENNQRTVCPTAGKIKKLYVQLEEDPGTAPDAYTFTLRVNGANSALTCTIVANDKTGNDTAHEVTVSAGDILTLAVVPVSTPLVESEFAMGMVFLADADGESLILGGSENDLSNSATEYHLMVPDPAATWTVTEAERLQLAQECTLKKLYVLLSVAPDTGNKYTFTVRLEGASPGGGLVVEIAGAATTGNDTVNTISVSDGNTLGMMSVPDSTPDVADAYWGLVGFITPPLPLSGGGSSGILVKSGLI